MRIDTYRLWEDAPLIGAAMYANQVLGRSGMEGGGKEKYKTVSGSYESTGNSRGVYDLYPAFPVGRIRSVQG